MKIIVSITNGKRLYSEDVTEDEKESFEVCTKNGANPWLNDFDRYTRELKEFKLTPGLINKYDSTDKDAHFIFGWRECFFQSDDVPRWMHESEEPLRIEVSHTEN